MIQELIELSTILKVESDDLAQCYFNTVLKYTFNFEKDKERPDE